MTLLENLMVAILIVSGYLLALVLIAAPMEYTAVGRRIADGLLARIFPPRDYED